MFLTSFDLYHPKLRKKGKQSRLHFEHTVYLLERLYRTLSNFQVYASILIIKVLFIVSFSPSSDVSIYDIALGTNSLTDYSDNLQFRGVREIRLHPQFDFFDFDYDVALLRLSEPVEITDYVRMACLPTENMDRFFPPGTVCTATGWGEETQFGNFYSIIYDHYY